jgi:epoxyqueuosine reductase
VDAAEAIRAKAYELGFDTVGFAPARLKETTKARFFSFLAAGRHGEMSWLAARAAERAEPQALWPDVRSVIVLGLNYGPETDPRDELSRRSCGVISVYARNRDYHDIVKGRLKHLAQFIVSRFQAGVKVFVDTAPVLEKPLGQEAGIGWQGKHTNLVSRRFGSWLFLGEIYTTLPLPPDPPHPDRCGRCRRCLDICPTGAFPAPYELDARRCISYLTIEHAGPVPEPLRPLLGNRIYGCDDCLAVCPWNRFAQAAREAKLKARPELVSPPLATLAALGEEGFRTLFRGSPVKRIGWPRFLRNVLYAIGNSADSALAPIARRHTHDPDPVVADAARWAAARLDEDITPGDRPMPDDRTGTEGARTGW